VSQGEVIMPDVSGRRRNPQGEFIDGIKIPRVTVSDSADEGAVGQSDDSSAESPLSSADRLNKALNCLKHEYLCWDGSPDRAALGECLRGALDSLKSGGSLETASGWTELPDAVIGIVKDCVSRLFDKAVDDAMRVVEFELVLSFLLLLLSSEDSPSENLDKVLESVDDLGKLCSQLHDKGAETNGSSD
jgi:hypothetical protein